MTDEQLDALFRSVPFDEAPDPAWVATSLADLSERARQARQRDASRFGRATRDVRSIFRSTAQMAATARFHGLTVLVLLMLTLLVGLLIAGVLRQPTPLGNGPLLVSVRGELEAIDPVTGLARSLVPAAAQVQGVSRSPDGRIATYWTTGSDGGDHLFAVDVDDGDRRELAVGESLTWNQSIDTWSPDSTSLATEVTLGGTARVLVVDVSSGQARVVTPPDAVAHNPLWSPDGRWIAFTPESGSHRGLSVMRRDGTDLHDVGGDLHGLSVSGPDTWSPDGQWIYFSADDGSASHVFRANVATRSSQQLTGAGLAAYATASSPDGSTIAFIVDADYGFDLWVAASDGTGAHRILESAGLGGWSSDGQSILVRWKPKDDALGGLGTIGPDGTQLHILVPFDPGCRHGWDEQCELGFGWGQARP